MDIYIVRPEDDINSIADKFGVSVPKIIEDNGLENPDSLVPGQALVITYPSQTHIVEEGDTLSGIASKYNVTVMQLLRNNFFLSEREHIFPGELLVVSHNTIGKTAIAGYAYSFINMKTLERTLPYLTYLNVINYQIADEGKIVTFNDASEIINMSISYATIPLMGISALSPQGELDIELVFNLLINENYQIQFTNNILDILQKSRYYGVNFYVSALSENNQELYFGLLTRLSNILRVNGYMVFVTVDPDLKDGNTLFQNINYSNASHLIDGVLFIRELWASYQGPPIPVTSVGFLKEFLDFVIPMVPPERIYADIPLLAYGWELPYSDKTPANCMSLDSAISLASDVGAVIQFDEASQTPFFQYEDRYTLNTVNHIVWFVDVRTFNAVLQLSVEKSIAGIGVWNIMIFYQQFWSVLISQFDVIKLLPEP